MLDLQDYPGQGSALVGILDAFMETKGIVDPETFYGFCAPVVPLAEMKEFLLAEYPNASSACGSLELRRE